MAGIDFATLAGAVSDEQPCGPDLDLDGDPDYMNFVARTEGLLPITFFSGPEGKPFDRTSIDFDAEFAAIAPILGRTRDIRLLVLLAKLYVLNRDLGGFAGCIAIIDALLNERWDDVHPHGTDGDFAIRMAALESLDDMPPIIFPLQYLPLVNHRRLGPLTYRAWMIATGDAKPREGEAVLDPAAIESAMLETELAELVETRGQFQTLQANLRHIREICVDRTGGERAAKLERLPGLVDKILTLMNGIVVKRDPSLAVAETGASDGAESASGTSAIPTGAVASISDVADARAAIGDSFGRFEPSNPALLLVRCARELMGKSFLDVIRALVPDHLEQAAVHIGKDQQAFDLPIARLSEYAEVLGAAEQDHEPSDPPVEQDQEVSDPPTEQDQEASDPPAEPASRRLRARTRDDAIRLLEQIATYYRAAEPSSPIPFLTERARSFAQRDFLSLLKEILPEGALKGPEAN